MSGIARTRGFPIFHADALNVIFETQN